jgi:hypothetical protein
MLFGSTADDGLVRGFREGQFEQQQLAVFGVQTRQGNHAFGLRHLLAQLLAIGFLAARRRPVWRRKVLVEEIPRALEIFENAQILVGGLPRVRDEQSNWIVL